MAEDRIVGAATSLTLASATIYITKVSPKVEKKHADVTDTSNYDVATNLIYASQIPTSAKVTLDVEGVFYKTATPAAVVAKLFDGTACPYATTFKATSALTMYSGNYDITDFESEHPAEDKVSWKGTLVSNGKITPNS